MSAEATRAMQVPRLTALIAERTGLHFPPERHADLQRGLAEAAGELGFADGAALADWLLSAPPSRSQLHKLASHLTVGETYFFRDRRVFEALAAHVLPELLARRAGERRLRVWSAGCCTGEEAYSLSILLQQCLPDAGWNASVLATDINGRFLEKAAAGEYGEWSFRDVPAGFRECHFSRTAEGRHAVLPVVRQRVRFALLNLVEDTFPSPATDTHDMDLIFCRNVLMYFAPAHAARVLERLRCSLREGGWLVLSASEGPHALGEMPGFMPVQFPGATLYRRSDGRNVAGRREHAMPFDGGAHPLPPVPAETPVVAEAVVAEAAPEGTAGVPGVADVPSSVPQRARALADQGRLREALSCCSRWVCAEPLDPAARYLHAMILQEAGDTQQAGRCLQQALYLDPDFVLAHFALGNLARRAQRPQQARRHFDNAIALLCALPPDAPLPDSGGMTAARLREMIESLADTGAGT